MRCPSCDAPALTDDARFCVGCGGPLAAEDPASGRDRVAEPDPIPPRTEPRPTFVPTEPPAPRAPRQRAPSSRDLPPLRDLEPTVPVPVVIGGVVVLLAILLLLLLASS